MLCPDMKELEVPTITWRRSDISGNLLKEILEAASSENYQTADLPQPTYDFEQEGSDYTMAQMLGTPRSRKLPNLQKTRKACAEQ